MSDLLFVEPHKPHGLFLHSHEHQWTEAGAKLNLSGTWSSLWVCKDCPDVGIGGYVGPVPPLHCVCGFSNRNGGKKGGKCCADCGRKLDRAEVADLPGIITREQA